MRLLNIHTLKLERFHDVSHTPRYVILSHQWSLDEVLFEDLWESPERRELAELSRRLEALQKIVLNVKADIDDKVPANSDGQQNEARGYVWEYQTADGLVIDYPHLKRSAYKYGWSKVSGSCQKAMQFGYQYIWLDTICIDKSSSSELSESINSMFNWYKGASMCFAYLQDTPRVSEEPNCLGKPCFTKSEWFRRGWTLQELIAPPDVVLFTSWWQIIGMRNDLSEHIASMTGISPSVLGADSVNGLRNISVAARMSWASHRETTRAEDRAYSLMGLFGVNMPTLYGEGLRGAFYRLQVEIAQSTHDESLLAWTVPLHADHEIPLLAPDPSVFAKCGDIEKLDPEEFKRMMDKQLRSSRRSSLSEKLQRALPKRPSESPQFSANFVLKYTLFFFNSLWPRYEESSSVVLGCRFQGSSNPLSVMVKVSHNKTDYARFIGVSFQPAVGKPINPRDVIEFDATGAFSGKIDGQFQDVFITRSQPDPSMMISYPLDLHAVPPNLDFLDIEYDPERLAAVSETKHPYDSPRYPPPVLRYEFEVRATDLCFCVILGGRLYPTGIPHYEICLEGEQAYDDIEYATSRLRPYDTEVIPESQARIRMLRANNVVVARLLKSSEKTQEIHRLLLKVQVIA